MATAPSPASLPVQKLQSPPASPLPHATESSRHSTPATSTVGSIESADIPQPGSSKLEQATAPQRFASPSSDHASTSAHPLASIKPAYFYPTDAHNSAQDGVPVFEPTMEQFQDFYAFCQAIDKWGMQAGIVKVVPPKEWRDALPDLRPPSTKSETDDDLADISKIRIRNAIVQHFTPAGSGVWRQTNITRTAKTWNAKQWADTCITEDQKGPEMDRMKWKAEVDGASNGGWGPKTIGVKDDAHPSLLEEDGVRTRSGKARPTTSTPLDAKAGSKRKRAHERSPSPTASPLVSQELKSTPESSPSKKKAADAIVPEDWRDFDYKHCWLKEGLSPDQIARLDRGTQGKDDPDATLGSDSTADLPQPLSTSDWNKETCREIESEYWRGLNFGKPPMYGADLKGSLFDHRTKNWNVAHLDNILTRVKLRRKLPGVNTPYLYWGMWRATFAWHVEDMDLYSINYIHFGAPKQWYSIRQADRLRFESAMAGAFPADSRRCADFMRHKSYLASPSFLASHGIRPLKLVHNAGEFVITYPYGYHSGFNLGYNCAESVNFALESWLDIGRKANYCHCDQSQNSVTIDVDAMLEESREIEELERKRELRRAKDDSIKPSEEEELERKRARYDKAKERRKLKKEQEETVGGAAVSVLPFSGGTDFYIDPKDASASPCVFCPADVTADLVPTPAEIPTSNNRLQRMAARHAHRLCASFIPETWVGKEGKSDVVCGIEGIDAARFALKCQICPNSSLQKLFPKIQCTRGKCPRSAHVSCALVEDHGWFVDLCANDVADRLEGKKSSATKEDDDEDRLVVLCRSHNPLFREAEEARKAEKLRERVSELPVPSMIKIRTSGGMYEALMIETRDSEDEVVIQDEDQTSTVRFQNILFENKAASTARDVVTKAAEATQGEEDAANKRPRRASRKAADIVAAAIAETLPSAELDQATKLGPISAPKKVAKPRAPRPSKKKTIAAAALATTESTNGRADGILESTVRGSVAPVRATQEQMQFQPDTPARMQQYQHLQPQQQPSFPYQHPYYPSGQSNYGSVYQHHDNGSRFGSASAHARAGYASDYAQQQHYPSPDYANRHAAYAGYSAQALPTQHYGHPAAAPYHGGSSMDRMPGLPTYAKPLSQQSEHRYGSVTSHEATTPSTYTKGGAPYPAATAPYAYTSYPHPQQQQQQARNEQAPQQQYGHYPQPPHYPASGRHHPAGPYESLAPQHHLSARYPPPVAPSGHYQRP